MTSLDDDRRRKTGTSGLKVRNVIVLLRHKPRTIRKKEVFLKPIP